MSSRFKVFVRARTLYTGAIIILVVAVLVALQLRVGQPVLSDSTPSITSTVQKTTQKPPAGLPAQLSIPSINIDAVIAHAGLTADGLMDIKKDPDQVAWYMFGTRPGDEGSAVIAGHSGWTGQHGSIFNELGDLKVGDKVSIVDQKGVTITFIVRESRKYDPNADAANVFKSYDGQAHLNLITCEGSWDNTTQSYSDRLVVFTDIET